jgi:methyl halide transferase
MTNETARPNQIDKDFWDERWKKNETGWDLKSVSPPLKAYFDTLENKDASILIPGCGNAYEAAYLLENGFTNITLIDIAPALAEKLLHKFAAYAGKELTIICGDFFKHSGKYDIIVEQTFFCALDPVLRNNYVEHMSNLLNVEGMLTGLLFDKKFEGGPPFGGCREEYLQLFGATFQIEKMESCTTSIPPRAGTELLVRFKKRTT